jgi:two-component system sensor histidine kinase YesM
VVRRFRDLSIRYKLLITYILLVLVSLCLFLAVSTYLVTRENAGQARRSAEHVFSQAAAYLQYKTASVRNLLYLLATSSSVQELFERRPEYYLEEIGRWPIDSQAFDKILYSVNVDPDISAIRFYMKYGLAQVFHNESYIPLEEIQSARWFHEMQLNNRRIYWFCDSSGDPSAGGGGVRVVRGVFSRQNVNELVGVIQFELPEDVLKTSLSNSVLTENTSVMLMDGAGSVLCSAGAQSPERNLPIWSQLRRIRNDDFATESWGTISSGGGRYLVGSRSIENSDWILFFVLPYRDIVRMSARPTRQILFVFLLFVPLTLLLAFFVSSSGTRRIQDLIRQMGRVVQGDFAVQLHPGNRDEIGELTRSFNYMITRIERLVEDKYRLGQEVKSLELKALQAQINPHFLYNTLDLVNWMSVRYKAHEIGTLVNALSRFYKLSLSRGEDTVSLREELEHVRTYVQIQNMRYGDNIELRIDVTEALLGCPILKLVMQPLVENCIFHGILPKNEEAGRIRITGELLEGCLFLHVQDDGVGMSEQRISEVLSGSATTQDHHGYGVRNIHERLRLSYGDGFGLSYRSEPMKGTTVTIKIPAGGAASRRRAASPSARPR